MYASLRALNCFADLTLAACYYNFSELANVYGLKHLCQSIMLARYEPTEGNQYLPVEVGIRTSQNLMTALAKQNLPSNFDAIHVHFAHMSEYVELCSANYPNLPIVYESHNIEYDLLMRSGDAAEIRKIACTRGGGLA